MTQSIQNSTVEGFRLSPQQRSLWSARQTEGQPFRALCAILIEGNLQPDVLKQALQQVRERHEILRTTFHRPPGIKTPFQVVSEELQSSWQTFDLSSLDATQQNEKIELCFADERERPFDFEQGPLLRVTLIKQTGGRHVLVVSLPGLCADSITLANFVNELSRDYESCLHRQEFGGETMQYADFAEWQNELLDGTDDQAGAGKAYWKDRGTAAGPAATLPLEKRRQDSAAFAADSFPVALDSDLFGKIEVITRAHETSVLSVLLTCWLALAWRLTGQSDLAVFSLCDGRKFEDLQTALGPYAKYLPIQAHCEDVSFAEHLCRVKAALNEAQEWQEYFDPCAFLTGDSVAFDFEERPSRYEAGGLSFSVIKQYACIGPFKLKLSFVRSGNALAAELHYNRQILDREVAAQIAGYFQRFLAGVLQNPEVELGAVELLNDDQRRYLLFDLNRTTAEFPRDKCIHQLFEEQAAKTPEAVAVVFDDQELSYDELNARANQLAHFLRRRGIGPNARVGLCTRRNAQMIIGLLGILKAGGAYVPLNPEHPQARLSLQLNESGASILITDTEAIGQPADLAGEVVDLDRDRVLLDAEPKTNPPSTTVPENFVYVIYTSGSTGIPKGVAVRHQSLVNYTHFILRSLQMEGPLHFATVSTITADLGNTCIFPSLVSGGCLHVIGYDVSMDGSLFRDYVGRRPIDVLKIVPSHLNALLASEDDGRVLPSKYLVLGGEPLSWELIERISRTNHTCKVINHYGPTETTVGSLTFSVESQDVSPTSLTVPVGRPIANTRVYILDGRLYPAPVGVAGELYIGGAGVADGYLNQPAETAARFVADPLSNEANARLYRTGDLARYLPDDNVEFLGRVDHQVKVRGFRVELGEIEGVLSQHHNIQQAVVTVRLDAGGAASSAVTQRLVAYLVPFGVKPPTNDELRNFLQQHLPDYMIPSAFVFLKSLPLTPNGKVDRAALPAPDEARPDLQRLFVAPQTTIEKELAKIWAVALKLDEVGVHDNFFDLGGHSLLATQVISRMRKSFQMEIPLRSLFESPTVAGMAEEIESAASNDAERLLAEIEQLSEDEAARVFELEKARRG